MSNLSAGIVDVGLNLSGDLPEEVETPGALFLFALVTDVVIGFSGMLGSLFVVIIMFSNKSMRSPCFQLIGGSSIGSSMVAAYYFGRGIDKIGELTGTMLSVERSVLICLLTAGVEGMFGIPFHALVTCLVGVDRTLSLLLPVKYRTFGKRYVIYILSASALLVIIQEIIGFVTAPLGEVIVCRDYPEALDPLFISSFAAINLFYCTAIVTVYGTMLVIFFVRRAKSQKESAEHNMFLKQQSAAMPTVMLMTVLYFVFGIMAEILVNVAVNFDPSENPWVELVMVMGDFLKSISSLVEVVSLSICSQKFRECAKAFFGMKTTGSITTITVTPSTHSIL